MTYRAIIWDFDGTVCDTNPAMAQAFADALADFGKTTAPDVIIGLVQKTLHYCADTLAAEHGLDAETILDHFGDHYAQIPPETQPLFPGIERIFERIQAAGGHNLLFTHRGHISLTRFRATFGLDQYFAEFVAAQDGFPQKPDPTGFLHLMDKYGLKPEETLAIGDRELDIRAGENAGIATCLFGPEPLDSVKPDYFVTSYDQLEAILFPAK
jgi:HAD superfamily hydrolase (TIGR01509 family)